MNIIKPDSLLSMISIAATVSNPAILIAFVAMLGSKPKAVTYSSST